MRIVMMGTGPFAVPTFRALLDSRHEVLALYTRPAKTGAGRHRAAANPMREVAEKRGLVVRDPQDINASEARAELASFEPDLLVVCDYGQILSTETLATARLGGINLHASLLPKYRGAAPINWAIYHGEQETGVTVIHMTPRLDAGPAIAVARTPIGPEETAPELEARLSELGAPLVLEAVEALETGQARPVSQDQEQATRAPRLTKTGGLIDWNRPAKAIVDQIRAFKPWPASYTFWQRADAEPLRLIVDRAEVVSRESGVTAGTILEAERRLVVAAGDQAVQVLAIQPAGKRVLSAEEFLHGYPVKAGDRLR